MPRTVILTSQTFEKIISFLGQYSNPLLPKHRCVEAFGFLFCRRTPNYYIIEDAVGVATGERLAVALKAEELALIEFLESQRPELFLGGWVHSHPGWGLFFSGTDEENQVFYQQFNEDGLGIVWDYTLVGKKGKGLGFSAFRLHDAKFPPGYYDVYCKLSGFSLSRVEAVFGPLGYNKKVITEAWRTTIEQSMLLTADEETRVRAEIADADVSTLMGASGKAAGEQAGSSADAVYLDEAGTGASSQSTSVSGTDAARATSLKEMGILHFNQKHYAQASKELQAGLNIDRTDAEAWAFYYMCLFNQGDRLAANDVFRELGDILAGDVSKWLEVARLCEERDNFEGAQHAYMAVIKQDPLNFTLLDKIKALGEKKVEHESNE
ncbi:MAG TPA: hypothetical protein VKK79_11780 [Candidatus Lokiarchaeia archaeon]|nr:hypothetical protein [Candidatus Lokiarchaeia archaeon]